MSQVDVTQLLAQMRALAARAEQGVGAPAGAGPAQASGQVDFANLLKESIDSVNHTQQQASHLSQDFQLGKGQVNLAEVMVALQKASVSFEAMVQVRNKLVSAYQEIMNMPL